MKKHIGVLIVNGPEVKSLIYSGLIDCLLENYDISILTPQPSSLAFEEISKKVKLLSMPVAKENIKLSTWRYHTRRISEKWMETLGGKKWNHYIKDYSLQVNKTRSLQTLLYKMITNRFNGKCDDRNREAPRQIPWN